MYRILAEVSLKNIAYNARVIKAYANKPLIAVVKDDAYAHGAVRVCQSLKGICAAFAVASVEEGAALRTAGVEEDILVLTPCLSVEEGVRLISYGLVASVSSLAAFRILERAEEIVHARARVHLSVNTGMNRYGVRPESVGRFCTMLSTRMEGLYSHLYAADSEEAYTAQAQIFEEACTTARALVPNLLCHLGATGGTLRGCSGDAVRVGIALYGYLPEGFEETLALKPAMKIYATVSHRCTPLGGGVGYAKAQKGYKKLYTLRLGYGDGFFRVGGVGEGKACMDASVCAGDRAVGKRKLIMRSVTAYAKEHGTSEYEALVKLGSRAEKKYEE